MDYEEFKKMMIRFFEEHPIKIITDRYHTEESSVYDDGIEINLSSYLDDYNDGGY